MAFLPAAGAVPPAAGAVQGTGVAAAASVLMLSP
jgi:hypothetical protein